MIKLEKHIEILLLKYECVIVPGLGGFVAHHVPAHYDEEERLFLPPLRTLGFNPHLKMNDSLLAQSYVEAYDISYPDAVGKIESEVNELKQHIQNEGNYELNDLGVLYLGEDGGMQFEPCEAGVLTPWLYGLGAFEMKSANVTAEGDATKILDKKQILKEKEDVLSAVEALDSIDKDFIKIKVSWIRNIVAAAAAVICFLLIAPPISNSYHPNVNVAGFQRIVENKSVEATGAGQIGARQNNQVNAVAMADTAHKEKNETVCEKAEVNEKKPIEKSEYRYCIVLASRITSKNAKAFVEELDNNGVNGARVYISNDIVRVVYGNYGEESDAFDTLLSKKGNRYFEQAWVYKIKK